MSTENTPVSSNVKVKNYKTKKELREEKRVAATAATVVAVEQPLPSTPSILTELVEIQPRTSPGTLGRKIKVGTNYLKIDITKLVNPVHHYDVSIIPDMPKKNLPAVFEKFRKINFPTNFIAFDGKKNAFSSVVLNEKKLSMQALSMDEDFRQRTYDITLSYAKSSNPIDLSSLKVSNYTSLKEYERPQRAIQVLDIIFRSCFANINGVTSGRSFFMRPATGTAIPLGDNYELWTGLFQSAILGYRPYLNVDVSNKAFPSERCILDVCDETMKGGELTPRDRDYIHSILKGVTVTYSPHPTYVRQYKYQSLKGSALTEKFMYNGSMNIVADYFKNVKKIPLKRPEMPCILVGNTVKFSLLPVEHCHIRPGQTIIKKMNDFQTRTMIKHTATSTTIRKNRIYDLLKQVKHNYSNVMKQFGVHVDDKFIDIDARVLPAPDIYYNRVAAKVREGVWNIPESASLLAASSQNLKWTILRLAFLDDSLVHMFASLMIKEANKLGITMDVNYNIQDLSERSSMTDLVNVLQQLKCNKIDLALCIIPDGNGGLNYSNIKYNAEIKVGLLTQCVKRSTVKLRANVATVSNILLKINAKFNGINHKLEPSMYFNEPFMFVGADVTHPSPEQKIIPSVVGVAASYDSNAFKYHMNWRLQEPCTEIIDDLENIMVEQLLFFKERCKTFPKKILFYRDGVSEGQFKECLNTELRSIRAATAKVSHPTEKYYPAITYIIVQKRHHTRFFPNEGAGDRKNNNVFPGTTIDTEITHPNETQFFMVSHQSIQGVSKPTKYCVLKDDSKLSMDKLQTLTYGLCHLFARCNRSISYPAPTYYAHLAAYRGRIYLDGMLVFYNLNKITGLIVLFICRDEPIQMDELSKMFTNLAVQNDIINKHPMYFI
jgi:eukaryotic translation initiation factor 2C